jgi:hypothetical protein
MAIVKALGTVSVNSSYEAANFEIHKQVETT